jgi:aspartyl-tRNA(Asn)/glutamyl-tRNA(Gln) amidotransferase subunit C
MAVSADDVRHVAELARIGVPQERIAALVAELNGILAHMEVLAKARNEGAAAATEAVRPGMTLRADEGPCVRLEHPISEFAPATRAPDGAGLPAYLDGYFLVPRLATHEDAGDES